MGIGFLCWVIKRFSNWILGWLLKAFIHPTWVTFKKYKSHPNKAVLKNKQKKVYEQIKEYFLQFRERGWIQINIFLFLCILVHANIIWLSLVFNV